VKKPVGLLWDSVSNNIGDRAIGVLMRRFLERKGIRFETADPFSYDPADYSTFIVGGGELLRPRGDPFYDRFRVTGPQILNAMGVHQPDELEYLNEYRLVAVRSQAEKKILDPVVSGVTVCPCTTLLLGDYFDPPDNPWIARTVEPGKTIGVHINLAISHLIPNLIPLLQSLAEQHPIVLFPFTLYQRDSRIQKAIRSRLPGVPVSPLEDPVDIYYAIGRMRAFICVSLHGTMFAYAQNVPMLAYPTVPKITHFLEERGLERHLFHTDGEIQAKLEELLAAPPDFSAAFTRDQKIARAHLEKIARLARKPVRLRKTVISESELRHRLALSIRAFHARWMAHLELWSQSYAERLEHQRAAAQLEEQIRSLQTRADQYKQETESQARTVQDLSARMAEKDAAVNNLTAQAAEKDQAIGELTARAAEKDQAIRELTDQAAEKDRSIRKLTDRAAEKDQTIRELMDQAAEKDRSIRELTDQATKKDRSIRELMERAAEKDGTIRMLSGQLADIKGSTAWSIVRLLWRVRLFFLPHGSRREWIGAMAFRSLKVLRHEGFAAFLRKARERIRRDRQQSP
jgi:hypothetical protein